MKKLNTQEAMQVNGGHTITCGRCYKRMSAAAWSFHRLKHPIYWFSWPSAISKFLGGR